MAQRFIALLIFTFSVTALAQTKQELKIKNFFWGDNDTHKDVTEIPEKWKNESAVILYKNQNYDFHKFGKNVTYTTSTRKRIKLLDKSAVKEYSEFSFSNLFKPSKKILIYGIPIKVDAKRDKNNHLGIKVIKPNGKEIEVDIDKELVQVDGESKIAISNLEVGDIIDYYIYKEKPFKSTYAFGFDPVETTLSDDYPIIDFKLFFETENDFFINFKSFNGAPELKEIPNEKRSFRRYSLEASNLDKYNTSRWFFPLVEMPTYKFQVYFARSGKFEDMALAFLPEKENIIKNNVTKEEVLELYDKRFKPRGELSFIKEFLKDKNFKSDSEKVKEVFYFIRHNYLTRYIEAFNAYEAQITYSPFEYYGKNPIFIRSDKHFIRHFTTFLKQHKISYEIVIGKKRYDGTIDDLLIEKNVNAFLKINTETPIYIEYFGFHTTINSFSSLLEDTDAYLLSATKNKIDKVKRGSLPSTSYLDNEDKKIINLEVVDNFSSFSVNRENFFKGHLKKAHQKEKLLFSDYVNEDYKKYDTKSYVERIRKKKTKAQVKKRMDALVSDQKEKLIKELESSILSEYELDDIEAYTYNIKETGRYSFDSYFTYDESFKIEDAFIKKIGPNYMIEIGKLIGGQISLSEDEKQRTENIHMNFPRSFNNEIRLTVPDGYTVSGLDKLKKNVDNKTGAFISDAKIEDNILVVTTSKQYKNNYEPNSNWPLMVDFLEAAFQFTNEKIVLKKK